MLSLAPLVLNIQPVGASGTIYIRADGSVDPPSAPIQRDGDTYTLTQNISDSIVVERDNIVINGAGHTVEGTETGVGIALYYRRNVTVKDFKVTGFYVGISLFYSNYSRIFGNIVAENAQFGIYLSFSSYNQVFWNKATNNSEHGIYLRSSDSNLIDNNVATNNKQAGIRLDFCSNCTVSFNTAKNNGLVDAPAENWAGIWLAYSPNSTVSDNTVVNNYRGIGLGLSGNSVVSNNVMSGNNFNFDVNGISRSDFDISVNPGNIVDGKPIRYLVNSSNTIFDSSDEAATIYIIDSVNVTIRNITLTNNVKGVFFWNTNNSRIENVVITDNDYGVELEYSNNITFSGNTVANNGRYGIHGRLSDNLTFSGNTVTNNTNWGIYLYESSGNILLDNTITNNAYGLNYLVDSGIYLLGSGSILMDNIITNNARGFCLVGSSNFISRNTISSNVEYGVSLSSSSGDNVIFHNNFINNQVVDLSVTPRINIWDDGATGNYWNDYEEKYPNATEIDESGIWSTPYVFEENGQDNYPLVEPWSYARTFNITWDEEIHKVRTLSNSTIASLIFNQTERQIRFKATGPSDTAGFCNVTIPKELLEASTNQWIITVNDEIMIPNIIENATHTFLYFTFNHSTQTVNIKGTNPIDNTKPTANAGPDQTVDLYTTVTLDGSASTDNIGITSYTWTFIHETPQTLTGISPTYTFPTLGTYVITLNVADLRGNSDTDTVTIIVVDMTAPVADAGNDQAVAEGALVTFNGSGTTDNVAPTGYTWRFTDMTPQTLTGKTQTYTFQTPGTYIVTLNVTDAAGNWHTDRVTITVRAVPVWTQSWFWAMILLIPTTSGLSYLGFQYARREGVYEQLQKLVRRYVREEIPEEVYEKKLKKIEERSDVDSRARIKEWLDVIMTYERAVAYIDRRKMEKK